MCLNTAVQSVMHFLARLKQRWIDTVAEVQDKIVSDADILRQEGRDEGREEGREEGLELGLRESILDIVQIRFKGLPETLRSKLEEIEALATLRRLQKSALEAQTLSQFEEELPH